MSTVIEDSPDSGTWSIESNLEYVRHSVSRNRIQQKSLKFTSERTEVWVDERQELAYEEPELKFEQLSKSVPPSPTLTDYSKQLECSGQTRIVCKDRVASNKKTVSCSKITQARREHPGVGPFSTYRSPAHRNNSGCSSHTDVGSDSASSLKCDACDASTSSHCSCTSFSPSPNFRKLYNRKDEEVVECAALGEQRELNIALERGPQFHETSLTGQSDTLSKPSSAIQPDAESVCRANVNMCEGLRNNYCSSVGWHNTVLIRPSTVVHPLLGPSTDAMAVFKYCINYPTLFSWTTTCMHAYLNGMQSAENRCINDLLNGVDKFIIESLRKREKKSRLGLYAQDSTIHRSVLDPCTTDYKSQSHQLWKRRYYNLLNAIDFVYKDYQILYYVSREGLFDCVSTPPAIPTVLFGHRSRRSRSDYTTKSPQLDPRGLAIVGTDPSSHLSDRVIHLLLTMECYEAELEEKQIHWPCSFRASVSFLSDVIAQIRILRSDLDRRLAIHDRLVYVLGQARQQKSKLRHHIVKQREMSIMLSSKLAAVGRLLSTSSPLFDQPFTIDDGLATTINSPFVDCENVEGEKTEPTSITADPQTKAVVNVLSPNLPDQERCINEFKRKRLDIQTHIAGMERVLKEEEARRRRLHNCIQELTGNIRVFCRLRPSENEKDSNRGRNYHLRVSSTDKLLFCPEALRDQIGFLGRCRLGLMNARESVIGSASPRNCANGTPRCFIFDRVFDVKATQLEVYNEVDDLIVSCIDGYNVCIMAYGQTGSGKTYTMMGSAENPGVNRRAVHSLFEQCNKRKHWKYSLFISMVEIYQEDVFDLLEEIDPKPESSNLGSSNASPSGSDGREKKRGGLLHCRSVSSRWKQPVPWNTWTGRTSSSGSVFNSNGLLRRKGSVKIISTPFEGVVLKNLREQPVYSEEDVFAHFELAEKQRRVGSTKLNICSSRSHLVIILKVLGENRITMTTSKGSLTLADLAGSENITKSGSTGERFTEAACINKSLSSLGRVFDALRRQQKPTYRETKLTYLLRPSLGGESKCLLFIALRTEPEHAEETWRAVTFGQGALQVTPGSTDTAKSRGSCISPINDAASSVQLRPGSATQHMPRRILPFHHEPLAKHCPITSGGHDFLTRQGCGIGSTTAKRGWK